MMMLGVVVIVLAIVLAAVGLLGHGLHVLLWIGIALLVVGLVLAVVNRGTRVP